VSLYPSLMSPLAFLSLAAALLFFPLWVWREKGSRLGAFEQRAWPLGRNLLFNLADVGRSALGAWALVRGVEFIPAIPEAPAAWMAHVWVAVVLGLALAVQAGSWCDEDHLHAPIAFLAGLCAVLVHPLVLALMLPLAIGSALAVRAWSACILAAGVGMAAIGLVVEQQDWRRTLFLGVAVNVPVLLAVMAGRHLGSARKLKALHGTVKGDVVR